MDRCVHARVHNGPRSFKTEEEGSLTTADDHALAADLADRAGRLLLSLRAKGGDADALRKAGDRTSHEFLMAELAKARPADAVLSEEGIDSNARLTADRVWIVDPLDGTREFGEPGRTDWAVHVALWERNNGPGKARRSPGRAEPNAQCRRSRRANRRRSSPASSGNGPVYAIHLGRRRATGPRGRFRPTFRRSVGRNLPSEPRRAAPPPPSGQPHESITAGQGRCNTA